MFKSIRVKLIFFSILVEVVMLTALITNSTQLTKKNLTKESLNHVSEIKSNFQATLLPLLASRDYATLNSLLDEYTKQKNISYIVVIKDDLIIGSSKWDKKNPIPKDEEELNPSKKFYKTSVSIDFLGQNFATVHFEMDNSFLNSAINELLSQSIMIGVVEVLLSILLLFSIGFFITEHLDKLTQAAENISNNNFDFKLDIKTKDEIGLLAQTFNKMTSEIKNQFNIIEEQNELQNALLNNITYLLITTDKNGFVTSFNKQAEITLGFKKNEIIGKHISIIHEKEVIKELDNLAREDKLTAIIERPYNFITKENQKVKVLLTINDLKHHDGEVYGHIGIAKDITEITQLQKDLDNETYRIKTILKNAGDGIHILDSKGNLVLFSDSFVKLLGYTKEELKNLNVKDWDSSYENRVAELIGNERTFETKHKRKDGTFFDVEIRTIGIEIDNEMYLYASSRDITERKTAQEHLRLKDLQLEQQSRLAAMGEMLNNIAHQWRQPLSLITSISTGTVLQKQLNINVSDDEIIKNMNNINNAAQHLSKTIDNFRNFSKSADECKEFDLDKVINNCIEITKDSFNNHYIKVYKKYDNSFIYFGSESMLSQVILNIFMNSRDAFKEKKQEINEISIFIEDKKEELVLSIKDNAGGIPENIINRIFEPYFTTKGDQDGTGIGLYMSSQIIHKHFDGNILVKNIEGENGKGAAFIISIPRTQIITSDC